MIARCWMVHAFALACLASSVARPADRSDPRRLIEAGIEAAGGRDALAKYRQPLYCEYAVTLALPQGRTAHAVEKSIKLLPEKMRYLYRAANVPKAPSDLWVVNGKNGWQMSTPETEIRGEQRSRGNPTALSITVRGVEAMSTNTLKSNRDRLYAQWLTTLLPLDDDAFKLEMVDEATVDENPAVGVKVRRAGHSDVLLFFDKSNSRIVRADWGKIKQHYSEPAEMDGLTYPTKITEYLNGFQFSEARISKFEFLQSVDKGTFEKP